MLPLSQLPARSKGQLVIGLPVRVSEPVSQAREIERWVVGR
jgi:hypothetical protein